MCTAFPSQNHSTFKQLNITNNNKKKLTHTTRTFAQMWTKFIHDEKKTNTQHISSTVCVQRIYWRKLNGTFELIFLFRNHQFMKWTCTKKKPIINIHIYISAEVFSTKHTKHTDQSEIIFLSTIFRSFDERKQIKNETVFVQFRKKRGSSNHLIDWKRVNTFHLSYWSINFIEQASKCCKNQRTKIHTNTPISHTFIHCLFFALAYIFKSLTRQSKMYLKLKLSITSNQFELFVCLPLSLSLSLSQSISLKTNYIKRTNAYTNTQIKSLFFGQNQTVNPLRDHNCWIIAFTRIKIIFKVKMKANTQTKMVYIEHL